MKWVVTVRDGRRSGLRLACGIRCSWYSQAPCGDCGFGGHCWFTKVPE